MAARFDANQIVYIRTTKRSVSFINLFV